jgi:hypothetical protein
MTDFFDIALTLAIGVFFGAVFMHCYWIGREYKAYCEFCRRQSDDYDRYIALKRRVMDALKEPEEDEDDE